MPVVSVGPFAVRLAGDASFPLEPPRLAREVDVTEPSESARTFRFAATTVADPPMDALVRCVTFASAIPAPPVELITEAPPTETVAVESACRPMNFELGDGGATVDVAEIAMLPALRLASVRVADADPVAFTSPLSAEPLWSFAA